MPAPDVARMLETPIKYPSYCRTDEVDLKAITAKSILKSETTKIKKKLSFAKSIEAISYFVHTEAPLKISREKVFLQDINDMTIRSVSSMLRIPEHWSINYTLKSNLSPNFSVILDQIYLEKSIFRAAVLVRNFQYHKVVTLRFTTNGWKSFIDVPAKFEHVVNPNSSHFLGIDRFCASIDFTAVKGQKVDLEFALSYSVGSQTYWDNNGGTNYLVQIC